MLPQPVWVQLPPYPGEQQAGFAGPVLKGMTTWN
jgi:hypothetical protein